MGDDMVQDALYKKDKIRINGGLPASSRPASFEKTGFKFIGVGGGGPPRGGGGGAPPPTPAAPPKPKCRALYPYDPVEPDELRLQENDIIEILEEDGDWWKGLLNGQEGLFPANYVEKI